ncbi:MerR family transcriptional regulator [Gloeobacter kilaueensis]|uniref:MerR family transcriptional regulator n=1 Tax=Gloeobacter kilaueensis (strain ATCC BAA-2537 / CCAP 1431/1 / ULC 316 / JS1) TaxID=1183438 RepID=U5QFC8_GLOK1|nr:MerR family transcriptional regulator [Gloeobacter kilaueensis]AGY56370.1 MerR family transcriptional regulator [Gloeobacter kilaueensis JS1]
MSSMDIRKKGYRIGELAHLAKVNPRTIDFYTREGLLDPLDRDDAHQHRYYSTAALDRLLLIKHLRGRHMSLAEIREHLKGMQQPEQREVIQTLQSLCQQIDSLHDQLEDVMPIAARSDRELLMGMTVEAMQKVATLTAVLTTLLT